MRKFSATKFQSAATPAAILLILVTVAAHAEGFRNPPPGTFNLGRAGGRIAQVDDSSAVQQNPANLVDLTAPEFQFTPSIVYIDVDFTSPSGQTASTKHPWKLLPNMFTSKSLYDGRLGVGLGITTPYGIANIWDDKSSSAFANPAGALRYQSPFFTELMTINVNPSIAVKANDHLSLGAGLDVMWSKLTLEQHYPWFLATGDPTTPEGRLKGVGSGIGAGANFGATWKITSRQRLALTVRTPIRVDYEGHFTANNVPAALGGGRMQSGFKSNIKFPTIIGAGYGIQLNDKVRVETDVEWLEFSNFKTLGLKSRAAQSLGVPRNINENWKNTFTAGIGGDWRLSQNWVLRAGYQFYESPVPNSTFSPTIPDANQNVFTVGLGYTHGRHSLEGGYGLDFYDDRSIHNAQNPAFNGKYKINVHLFSLGYRYSF